MEYKKIFEELWFDYSIINPSVKKIRSLLNQEGEKVVNDHVAFRTFNLPGINIEKLAVPFIEAGYIEKGTYFFEDKKLNAKHYEHKTDKSAPRVFISELIVSEFSEKLQELAKMVEESVVKSITGKSEIIFSDVSWGERKYGIYNDLLKESEYAAWLYAYGYRVNHFTVSINHLKKYNSLEKLNELLKENGYRLNTSGGEIKGSVEEGLKQSSIMADIVKTKFESDVYEIPCCYYEFAERFELNGELFSGFIANSANKIFESTYVNIKSKN